MTTANPARPAPAGPVPTPSRSGDGHEDAVPSTFPVRRAWDGQVLGFAPRASAAQAVEAIERAAAYLRHPVSAAERASILDVWADRIDADRDGLAELVCLESGKTLANARAEVTRGAATLRHYARAALVLNRDYESLVRAVRSGERALELDEEGLAVATHYRPLGVVAAFAPHNFPLNTLLHKCGAAIAAGCPCVVKPSEKTPLVALRLASLLDRTLPEGLLSILSGHHEDLAEVFLTHPAVACFSLTGHSDVGIALADRFRRAPDVVPFRHLHLELGGNAPQLVLADVDPVEAAKLIAEAVFDASGSRCTTPRKILVPAGDWSARFVAAAAAEAALWPIGDPLLPRTRVGSLIDEAAARTVERRVREACDEGARLVAGGTRHGASIEATVLADVRPTMRMFTEENFGPVLSVLDYGSIDEAVRLANLGDHALQPAVLTEDLPLGLEIAARIRGGVLNVGWAATSSRSDTTPFGGTGRSGIGKEGGLAGVRELCHAVPVKVHPPLEHRRC